MTRPAESSTSQRNGAPQSIASLASLLGGRVEGDGDVLVTGINAIDVAGPDQITFALDQSRARRFASSDAAAAVVTADIHVEDSRRRPLIRVEDAELASAKLLELFQPPTFQPQAGVHRSAVVDSTATVAEDACIGPHVSIGPHTTIGSGAVIHSGVRIASEVVIDEGGVIHANCVIGARCRIGRRVILQAGVVIGADGFGYRPDPEGRGLIKMPHIGNVVIEDDVEIGANTCIDRGKFGSTVIGAGTKIDNLVQIGHNCRIGRSTVIAGCCAIAGSVVIGDGCQIGGQSAIHEHVQIGNGVRLGGRSGVIARSVPDGATLLGYPAEESGKTLRQWAALRKLPGLLKAVADRKDQPGH